MRKTFIQKTIPAPIRKTFRWMNYHFSENGRIINSFAKQLPQEQRGQVVEHGKNLTTARAKKNLPRGFRNVMTSLVVGQCMWYFACPAFSELARQQDLHPAVTWIGGGGLDKLFLAADSHLFQTGGQSEILSNQIVAAVPKTFVVGLAALGLELATDFSRCFIEYWSQKKYGLVADGAARLYGQTRPFPVRYSSFEAYQKIASYIVRPWAIGTPNQLFSSVYGILGSVWRTTIQLGIVVTVGTRLDRFFKKISQWTGLDRFSERIKKVAAKKEENAINAIRDIVGEEQFLSLQYRITAESYSFWKWNPFRPALSWEKARQAAALTLEVEKLQEEIGKTTLPETSEYLRSELLNTRRRMADIFNRKYLKRAGCLDKMDADGGEIKKDIETVRTMLEVLRTERELN